MNIILINARAAGFQLQCRQAGSFAAQLRNKSLCTECRTVASAVSRFVCFIFFLLVSFSFLFSFLSFFLCFVFFLLFFAICIPFLVFIHAFFLLLFLLISFFLLKVAIKYFSLCGILASDIRYLDKTFYWFSSVLPDKFRAGTKTLRRPPHHSAAFKTRVY